MSLDRTRLLLTQVIGGEGLLFSPHIAGNLQNAFAYLRNYSHDAILGMSILQLILVIFLEDYIEEVLITETNKGMSVPMDIQAFIQWVGCWLYIACWVGIESRWDWFSMMTPSMDKGTPFRLNHIMSRNRFDYIICALCFTNSEVPYEDGLLQMRQLEEAWNHNMAQQFLPSWINVLDESMMEWFNKWDPGFMCVGRKPHPF